MQFHSDHLGIASTPRQRSVVVHLKPFMAWLAVILGQHSGQDEQGVAMAFYMAQFFTVKYSAFFTEKYCSSIAKNNATRS
jgi:hypothetical protein